MKNQVSGGSPRQHSFWWFPGEKSVIRGLNTGRSGPLLTVDVWGGLAGSGELPLKTVTWRKICGMIRA